MAKEMIENVDNKRDKIKMLQVNVFSKGLMVEVGAGNTIQTSFDRTRVVGLILRKTQAR